MARTCPERRRMALRSARAAVLAVAMSRRTAACRRRPAAARLSRLLPRPAPFPAQHAQGRAGMLHPALRITAVRRVREKGVEMHLRALCVSSLEQEKGETVVGARELRLEIERAPVAA